MKIILTPQIPQNDHKIGQHLYIPRVNPIKVNEPTYIYSDKTISSLPETHSLQTTPSSSQISPSFFNLNFPNNLDARYREQSSSSIPLRLDWNTFVSSPPLFGQHQESSRLIVGHSVDYNIDRIPTKIFDNIIFKSINKIVYKSSLKPQSDLMILFNTFLTQVHQK